MTAGRDVIVTVRPLLPPVEKLTTALAEVFDSGVITNDGPRVRALESLLSAALGMEDLAVCASGTTAIQLACCALEMTGEVLVPAAAFPAAAQAVLRAGGTPIAVDIEPTYLTMDPAAAAAAVTPRTCGIMAVHTFGCPADVDALESLAATAGIPLLFDGAACWGVRFRDRPLLSFGDASTLSLHATKLTHSVEGGAVMSRTRSISDKIRRLRNFGSTPDGALAAGTNARMSELHAAVGAIVLGEAGAEISRRQAIRRLYEDGLRTLPWLEPCAFRSDAASNIGAFPVRLAPDTGYDAEQLSDALLRYGVHTRAYFAGRYRIHAIARHAATPHADAAARSIVCLPFWGAMTSQEVFRVIEALRAVHTGHRAAR
jgi:dTDP-4-amino-4,6-dideoxygalactose transaminase